ncbi:MFS transporter [Rhodococcus erythropolis]
MGIVALCTMVNILDGYDIFVIGYVLPRLPEGFATSAEKGYLVSAALAGIGIGSFFLSRFADIIGRRPTLLTAIVVNTIGLTGAYFAPNFETLLASRFVIGLAVGVIAILAVVISQEHLPKSLRSIGVGVVMFGYPLGGFLAGIADTSIVDRWQTLFLIAILLSITVLVATIVGVPETIPFLRRSGNPKYYERAKRLAKRIHVDEESGVPGVTEAAPRLLAPGIRLTTVALWLAYPFATATYYFIGSWTPQLIKDATGDIEAGASAGIMISLGTMTGALIYAFVALRRPSTEFAWVAAAIAIVSVIGFAVTIGSGGITFLWAALLGAAVYGIIVAYTGMANSVYPANARAKGYGVMVGVGRLGAILSPILAGYAVNFVSTETMYLALIAPLAVLIAISVALGRSGRA